MKEITQNQNNKANKRETKISPWNENQEAEINNKNKNTQSAISKAQLEVNSVSQRFSLLNLIEIEGFSQICHQTLQFWK